MMMYVGVNYIPNTTHYHSKSEFSPLHVCWYNDLHVGDEKFNVADFTYYIAIWNKNDIQLSGILSFKLTDGYDYILSPVQLFFVIFIILIVGIVIGGLIVNYQNTLKKLLRCTKKSTPQMHLSEDSMSLMDNQDQ